MRNTLTLTLATLSLILLGCFAAEQEALPEWAKNNLEELVGKKRTGIEVIKAIHFAELGAFVGTNITTEEEAKKVLDFFFGHEVANVSIASRILATFTLTNVIMIIGYGILIISVGGIVTIFILPVIAKCSPECHVFLAYIASTGVLYLAFIAPSSIQNFVALGAALAYGGSYLFMMCTLFKNMDKYEPFIVLFPVLVLWGILAVVFKTQLIGFCTVALFEALLGFMVHNGHLSFEIGFERDEQMPRGLLCSGLLMLLYVIYSLDLIPGTSLLKDYISVFESGALFLSTFVFFVAILILSSGYSATKMTPMIWVYNALGVIVGLGSFYVGGLSESLGLFRGVAGTYFVLFILQKWVDVSHNFNKYLVAVVASLIVISIAFVVKCFPKFFVL